MKKKMIFCFLFLAYYGLFTQAQVLEVVSSSGDYFKTANAEMSWTIGEPIIETFASDNTILTQGFQQTNLIITALADLDQEVKLTIFPNPTRDIANIEFKENTEVLRLQLVDVKGRPLLSKRAPQHEAIQQLNLAPFSAGTYYLQLMNADATAIKTFKIIKLK